MTLIRSRRMCRTILMSRICNISSYTMIGNVPGGSFLRKITEGLLIFLKLPYPQSEKIGGGGKRLWWGWQSRQRQVSWRRR